MNVGHEEVYDGQVYRLVELRPYTRRNGTETTLAVWRSCCAKCGDEFELITPTEASKFSPNRRCKEHRRPGAKVRKRTRRHG